MSLSDKREHIYSNRYVYPEKDIKEFIRKILLYGEHEAKDCGDLMAFINKEAGEKLI